MDRNVHAPQNGLPRHFLRAFLLALFLPLALLSAKEKEPVITPSFAKPVEATIFLGGTIEIPLAANAPAHGTRYLLRSQPRKGQLDEIVTADSGHASVVYRNDARGGTGTDTFTYAVQSPGAAVSSRATVTVKVINRPPHIEAPGDANFGNVPVGSTARRVVTLENSGGEPFVSQIQLSSPWRCEVGRLEIPPGKSKDVVLEFSPDVARTFAGEWFLAGAGGTGIQLAGTGYIVFDVSPSFLKLQESPDGTRSEKLTVSNRTDERVEVSFACPGGLLPIAPLLIEGGGQAAVKVEADPARPAGGKTSLTISDKSTSRVVEILIPPLPAKLSVGPSSSLDFGEVPAGKSAAREISVSNSGGLPAAVEVSCPNWILPDTTRLVVKPGEERKIRLEAVAARPVMLRDRMLFKYDNTAAELVVSITVPAGGPSPSSTPAPEKPAAVPAAKHLPLRVTKISQDKGAVSVCWQDPNPDRRTYRVDSLRLTSSASLARQAAIGPDVGSEKFSPEEFAAERLKLSKIFEQASKNDKVVKIWSPLEKLDLRESGNATFTATFPAQPNAPAMRVRISSVLPDGSTSPVQTEIRIPLVQPPPRRWPVKTILLTLAALAAATVLVRKKIGKSR
jgi:hypothetical protein